MKTTDLFFLLHNNMKRVILLLLLAGSLSASPANQKIIYNWGTAVTNYPVQMGWFFAKGEIPHGKYPQVLVNGTPVTTQAELKDEWPSDNSVRFVVVSFLVPTMPAASGGSPGVATLTIQQQNTCNCILDGTGTAQTQAQMLAGGYNFEAKFTLTQPKCSVNGTCNTKTASARQMITDGKYTVWTGGPVATTVILADDAGRSYDMGWERDANTGQNTYVDIGSSLLGTATSFHVADAYGWAAPMHAQLLETNAAFDPLYIGFNQPAETITIATITKDSPSCSASPCPATLSGVTRHSDTNSSLVGGGSNITIDATHKAAVYPELWKEPTNAKFNSFRPRVEATFWPTTNQVKVRFIGEVGDTERFQDLTYSLTLIMGNTSPVTVMQQPYTFQYAATRWTMSSYDWCEAITRINGGANQCTGVTITPTNNHTWSVSPTGITAAIIYPRELWIGGDPQPISIDHNAIYMGAAGATFNFDVDPTSTVANRTITEATLNKHWRGECCNIFNATGNYSELAGAGFVGDGVSTHPANLSGVTSTQYRTTAYQSQMAGASPNMGGGGGGGSEDATGPWPLWLVDWMFSMSQGVDHGLRSWEKSRTNAEVATNWPFHIREGKSGSIMDWNDSAGAGVGLPISIANRPTLQTALAFQPTTSADRVMPIGATASQYLPYNNGAGPGGWTVGFNHHFKAIAPIYAVTGDPFYLEELEFWTSTGAYYTPWGNGYQTRGTCSSAATCYGNLPQTINQDSAGFAWAARTSGGILTFRAETAGLETGCATLSSGNCVPSTQAKYYRNLLTNAICGMEGAKNYTGGCNTFGTTLQKAAWTFGKANIFDPDILRAANGSTLGLPLNAFNNMDSQPGGGPADCNYGMMGPYVGRGQCANYFTSPTVAAHSSGAAIQLVKNTNIGGPTNGTIVACSGCAITQALQGKLAVTESVGGSGEIVLTMASVPSAWVNGYTIAVMTDTSIVANYNYGALGIWTLKNVTATQVTLTGSSTFPAGATLFPAGLYATDHQFTINSAAATAIAAAQNDCNNVAPCGVGGGPPGVHIQVATPTEYVIVCSVNSLTVTLCPADNNAGMRAVLIHFGSHYIEHGFSRCQDFECGNSIGEPKLWLGSYFGKFWVDSLTDGTHTPRTDFNPYLMSLGRFPFVAPDAHTLVTTWARAQAGFDYDAQSFNRWILSGDAGGTAGLAYASQMNGTISWALDFGTPNAQLAWNWLTSAGNLHSQTNVNNAVDAKWLFAPRSFTPLVCTITTPSLPGWTINVPYSQSIGTTGCASPAFSVSAGSLPAGLNLNTSSGAITGTPSNASSYSFTIAVADANGNPTQAYTVVISSLSGDPKINATTISGAKITAP